eukprot:TRINITY_DN566_c0_g1_i3.p1 TRINITY_DN566_c0_g1~~TRINITY_DN566_c0_g1_i3.p1  ORF type:complete len:404 (-),score=106.51 TRINITY_DN566_c0_g1_i3:118-1329(-)
MTIRLILVLISCFLLQNTPSVSANGYVRFVNLSPNEVFITLNSVTQPSTTSGSFTQFFSFAAGTQNISVTNIPDFNVTITTTFTVTDLVSKFIAIVYDGSTSYLLEETPEVNVTSAPVGFASIMIGNYAPATLAVSVDGTVHAPYNPSDFTEEIVVNTTDPTSFTNTTTRNISIQLVIGGTSTTSFTLQIQSEAKYLVFARLESSSVVYTVVQYAGNKVELSYTCNQVWTATNPDPYPITFKWDWRPRKKRFSMTLGALSSNLLVVETKQNANSKKIFTYQYDSDNLKQKVVQTIFDKKCISVSSICRGKYKLTNLALKPLPVVYESFSPSGLNDGLYTTLTNSTYITVDVSSTTTVNTTAVSAPYFKTGYQEVFKVWLAVNGAKSRLLSTYQGAVSQGSKCT